MLGWTLLLFGAMLVAASLWVRQIFGVISVDQMLMHLPTAGGEAPIGAETGYVSSFVWQVFVAPVVFVVLVAVGKRVVRSRRRNHARSFIRVFDPESVQRAARRARRARRASKWSQAALTCIVLLTGCGMFAQTVELSQHVRSLTTDLTLSAYYVEPTVAALDPQAKNLVLVYLESMEEAFSDKRFVEENALRPLERETRDWASIDRLRQYDGGGWTMAGIVGTQCGIPLRGTQTARENELEKIGADADTYLPGATCLGDVLRDAGYTSVFLGGADASFASKGLFLSSHGYDEVLDLEHWQETGDDERSNWGISDRALMEHAKQEVDRLHDSGQPFNLTLLTLDTHDPAHVFDYCEVTTDVEMTSIMRCSMKQVADFVDHLERRGYLDDTVVVIMGDHERFISDQSGYQSLASIDERPIFNRIWSPDEVELVRQDVDQLSLYATMLDLLGFETVDHRAGVGVSALVEDDRPDSILALSPEQYREVVESRSSDLYTAMWGLGDGEMVEADFFDPKNPARTPDAAVGDGGIRWWQPSGLRDTPSAPLLHHAG